MAESSAGSTPTKTITRVAVSPCSKEQICFLCAKQVIYNDYRRRLIGSGGRKNKACLDLEILAGRQFTQTELTTNINCADKNETIVNKVNLFTNSLKTDHEAIAALKESGTSTKRLLMPLVARVKDRFSCRMPHKSKPRANKNLCFSQEMPKHKQIYLIHQRRRLPLKLAY